MDFRRGAGEGGASQRWIDHNLPRCPLCRSESLWEVATEVGQQAESRWVFRCPSCKAVLSTAPEVAAQALAEPVYHVQTAVNKSLRVESVDRKEDEDFVGEEFSLAELQEWASEDGG